MFNLLQYEHIMKNVITQRINSYKIYETFITKKWQWATSYTRYKSPHLG